MASGIRTKRFGPPHRFDPVDVADDAAVARWAKSVLADGGAPDLLLNNAAIVNRNAPLVDVPPDEFSRVIDINIKGIYHVIRHFVPAMIERGKGVIVNFSSGWGRSTSPEVAPYCATKYAVSFPMSSKIEVNGASRHALYAWLTSVANGFPGDIAWNFEKFLISRDGRVLKRYPPPTKPEDRGLMQDIADALEDEFDDED